MKSAPSVYYAPTTAEEAYSLLSQNSDEAKILAGGQSLFPVMAQPSMLIDINQVHVLDEILPDERGGRFWRAHVSPNGGTFRGGTWTSPILAAAIEWIGHPQIRNRGIIDGNMAHADPPAELPVLATVLGATFSITNGNGKKRSLKRDTQLQESPAIHSSLTTSRSTYGDRVRCSIVVVIRFTYAVLLFRTSLSDDCSSSLCSQ